MIPLFPLILMSVANLVGIYGAYLFFKNATLSNILSSVITFVMGSMAIWNINRIVPGIKENASSWSWLLMDVLFLMLFGIWGIYMDSMKINKKKVKSK